MSTLSRTRRFLDGVGLGYTYQALIMVVGLWLTPFLLHNLGQHDLGVWMVGTQLLTYLALLDIGVITLVPRETAYVTGRASSLEKATHLSELFGRMAQLLLVQTSVVILAVALIWFFMPVSWYHFRGPIAVSLATFALVFPLRIFQAVLQGLQDFKFVGRAQIVTWTISTAATVALVLGGMGLYALAIGWALSQLLLAAVAAYRVCRTFPMVLPHDLPKLSWDVSSKYLTSGFWITLAQVASTLLATDVLIIGKFFGPSSVVPYACTNKLASVLSNQPTLIMQAAEPGLSELRTGASRERILQAVTALTQAILMLSGLVACVVLGFNRSFVTSWVGASQFSGLPIMGLFLLAMMLRHWNTTAVYSIFCFGYERRISLTAVLDGAVTACAGLLLVWRLGPIGAPIGSILGVSLVSLPANMSALKKEVGVSFAALVAPLWPWFWRFLLLSAALLGMNRFWQSSLNLFEIAGFSSLVGLVYVAVMFGPLKNSVLGGYLMPRVTPVWNRLASARSFAL